MAQAIAEQIIKEQNLDISADSAGLAAFPGAPASENAVKVIQERGGDLSDFRSKSLTKELADSADNIYCMTGEHLFAISRLFPEAKKKCFLLSDTPIPDPYGQDSEVYRKTANVMEQAIKTILDRQK